MIQIQSDLEIYDFEIDDYKKKFQSGIITEMIFDKDWDLAKNLGKKRLDSHLKLELNKKSKGWGNRSIDQESIGILGELLISRYFGCDPNFVYNKPDKYDLFLNGKTIDVKTSLMKENFGFKSSCLLAHKISSPKDIYIHVLISADRKYAYFTGWTTRKFLINNSEEIEYNNHILYKLKINKLFDLDFLKKNLLLKEVKKDLYDMVNHHRIKKD